LQAVYKVACGGFGVNSEFGEFRRAVERLANAVRVLYDAPLFKMQQCGGKADKKKRAEKKDGAA